MPTVPGASSNQRHERLHELLRAGLPDRYRLALSHGRQYEGFRVRIPITCDLLDFLRLVYAKKYPFKDDDVRTMLLSAYINMAKAPK